MKRRILIVLLGVCFSTAFAQGNNSSGGEKLGLIFKNKTVYLDTSVQKDLFSYAARPSINIRNGRIEMGIAAQKIQEPISVWNWDFVPEKRQKEVPFVAPQELYEFLKKASLLDDSEKKESVYITKNQDNEIMIEGKPFEGFLVDTTELSKRIHEGFWIGKNAIEVPFRRYFSRPKVAKKVQEDHRIHEIIAMGKSNFSGSSQERAQNIKLAAEKINGTLIPQGKRFSFNKTIQSITKEEGFQDENVIKGSKTVKEVGGGVCEVSTATFRAAFWGGLPITERQNHSFALDSYLPYGLDAAIYIGAKDLRFRNDTPGDVLVHSFTDDDNIYVALYGMKDNRKISSEGPFVTNVREPSDYLLTETGEPQIGFETEWIRKIEKNGEIEQEVFASIYRPWVEEPQDYREKKISMKTP